jgi:hypothetical protein
MRSKIRIKDEKRVPGGHLIMCGLDVFTNMWIWMHTQVSSELPRKPVKCNREEVEMSGQEFHWPSDFLDNDALGIVLRCRTLLR